MLLKSLWNATARQAPQTMATVQRRGMKTMGNPLTQDEVMQSPLVKSIQPASRHKGIAESFDYSEPVHNAQLELGDLTSATNNSQLYPPGAFSTPHDLGPTTQDERQKNLAIRKDWAPSHAQSTVADSVHHYAQVDDEPVLHGKIGKQGPGYPGGWKQHVHGGVGVLSGTKLPIASRDPEHVEAAYRSYYGEYSASQPGITKV